MVIQKNKKLLLFLLEFLNMISFLWAVTGRRGREGNKKKTAKALVNRNKLTVDMSDFFPFQKFTFFLRAGIFFLSFCLRMQEG